MQPAEPVSPTAPIRDAPQPAPPRPRPYAFSQLPTFSKVLFYLRANHPDPQRMDFQRALLGALDLMQKAEPELRVTPTPPNVVVRAGAQEGTFSLARVNEYWSLRSTLQDICRLIEAGLPRFPPEHEGARLLALEVAAANGLLQTFDRQSILIDPSIYGALRSGPYASGPIVGAELPAPSPATHKVLEVPNTPGRSTARIGYLALADLGSTAARDVQTALSTFERQRVDGIIFDLRDNHGGLYEQAVKIADAFVGAGTLVSMVSARQRRDEIASTSGSEPQVGVVALVNRGTAAGAEIIVTALRDHDRALIIGEPTAGAGAIQQLFDIPSPLTPAWGGGRPEMLGLKLTTAEWRGPSGARNPDSGIAPDIRLASDLTLAFARDLLVATRAASRRALLEASKPLVQRLRSLGR
jgi:hypothetical protein